MKLKKKLISMSSVLSLILVFIVLAPYAVYANNPVNVTIDGFPQSFPDGGPVIINGRTLIPVRGVFENLGFNVSWNPNTQRITLTGHTTVVITIGSSTFTTGGVNHNLDVPAQIIGDRAMLPIRAVIESIGYRMDWEADSRTVRISTSDLGFAFPYFVERNSSARTESQPSLVLYENGRFVMVVNLRARMGIIQGSFRRSGELLVFNVTDRDFSGYGANIDTFTMNIEGNRLVYYASPIGMTTRGSVFYNVDSIPPSLSRVHYNA